MARGEKEGAKFGIASAGNFYRKRQSAYLEVSLVKPISFVVGVVFKVDGTVSKAQVFKEPGEKFLRARVFPLFKTF